MTELNCCSKCGAPAVEHIRGEFHATTRDDIPENHKPGAELVQVSPGTEDDYRISCSKCTELDFVSWNAVGKLICNNHTPWSTPTLKEVAKQRLLWNELNPIKVK